MKPRECMKKKLVMLLIGATLSLLLSLNIVFSLGVAPSSYSVGLDEANGQYKLRIINSEGTDRILEVQAKGPLAEYVTIEESIVSVSYNEPVKTIYYTVDVPDDLPPGPQRLDITITELPDQAGGNTQLSASLEIGQKMTINVPYPGVFLTGDLFINGDQVNSPLLFTAHVINRGQSFTPVSGQVRILGNQNEELGRVSFPEATIGGTSDRRFTATFSGLSNAGMYRAEADLYYGEERLVLEKNFAIGNLIVEVLGIRTNDFDIGDVAKLTIDLENKWNQRVEDIVAEMTVYTLDGRTISTFTTSPIGLSAYQTGSLDAFWDTDGIPIGDYSVLVTLFYNGQSADYLFDAALGVDGINIVSQSLGGQVIAESASSDEDSRDNSLVMLFILLIVVVIIINLVWLSFMRKSMMNKNK